jgi:excisionase family DNA binding protein
MQDHPNKTDMQVLFSVEEAADRLGRISTWTLRKHIARGNVNVIRIGRRVLIAGEEVQRIYAGGLPSLTKAS